MDDDEENKSGKEDAEDDKSRIEEDKHGETSLAEGDDGGSQISYKGATAQIANKTY